ncbi:hypothetical protein FN846DRAFT_780989 [Sphaerosporella brunnea]|uniref:Uncharacterized protein n=1 Tax=Sphaerosporella brunnea TaxID=1250544 RepID=A0A5J5ERW8_9PEZI|nr:hypothetical protein FN846DRAFT_780989 [Sphaerosporella brunnea]
MRLLSNATLLFLLLRQAVCSSSASPSPSYVPGDKIPIECLNRHIDTGEHIQDPKSGKLQYVPFATCNETGLPLHLQYLAEEEGLNCTLQSVTDEQYHLFEFYVHHDSPLSCRMRARPAGGRDTIVADTDETVSEEWVPLIVALSGKLESSHLHISTSLNLLVHLSASSPGVIDSAAAYSVSPALSATRLVIGDPLPLRFRVRWYPSPDLPSGGRSSGHGAGHTLFYCVLSAAVGAVGCYAWVVGVDVPRRLRRVTVGMRGRDGGGANGGIIGAAAEKATRIPVGYGFPGNGNGSGGGYGYGGKRRG